MQPYTGDFLEIAIVMIILEFEVPLSTQSASF
jgi:hypothetical protein